MSDWEIEDGSTEECFNLWPTEGEKVALLDADLIPYRVGFTLEMEDYYRAVISVERGDVSDMSDTPQYKEAINRVDKMINDWVEASGADAAILFLTDCPEQERYDFAFTKPYKDRASDKPPFFAEMKEYIRVEHEAEYCTEWEADDGMAIWQCKEFVEVEDEIEGVQKLFAGTVIVSVDKDLRMIPGWHYNPVTDITSWADPIGGLSPVYNDADGKMKKLEGTGMLFFYSQILVGDPVDTYPGLPRCGIVKAYEVLNGLTTEKEMWKVCLELYKKKYKAKLPYRNHDGKWRDLSPVDLMVEQGRLAWMQRAPGEIWREDKNRVIRRSDDEWRDER